jgi:radical SAM protein with 4Fe4S-binding SPASM domain
MAPDIFSMVEYCKGRGIACGFNTNGTLLTRRTSVRLIELGLDWLHVSIDGASKATYEFVRAQSNWDTVVRNVNALVDEIRKRDAKKPQLSLVMVLMRNNLRELPAIVERAAEWGVPRVRAQNLSHDFSDAPPAAYRSIAEFVEDQTVVSMPAEEVLPVLEEAQRAASQAGISLRLPSMEVTAAEASIEGTRVGCTWPWRSAYVTYDSKMQPCCMVMGSDRATLGSLKDASFAEAWSNEDYRAFRKGLMNGNPHAVCRGCSEYRGVF